MRRGSSGAAAGGQDVEPEPFEPGMPWQDDGCRPYATPGPALGMVVERGEMPRQPFVRRDDGIADCQRLVIAVAARRPGA